VSNIGQSAVWQMGILFVMTEAIRILNVEKDGEDGVIVTFSDGTLAGYVAEELLLLRPIREAVEVGGGGAPWGFKLTDYPTSELRQYRKCAL